MRDYSLLVGNGINNISEGHSWADVLKGLEDEFRVEINTQDKPFPLAYEEIYFRVLKTQREEFSENEIKTFIANKVNTIKPNEIHERIVGLACDDIMTTNYDLAFECCLDNTLSAEHLNNKGKIKESKYNVFRHHEITARKIWHIHGALNSPASITLGYEHYSGYLQSMRSYTTTGSQYADKYFDKPLTRRLKTGEAGYSWIDNFFTKDIYIIGLNLDFVEIDLWWLLTFRERSRLINKKDFVISNQLTYYIPRYFYNDPAARPKIELLKSVGVIVNSDFGAAFKGEEKEYYLAVINHIDQKNCG